MPKIVDHQAQKGAISAEAANWIARRGIETLSLRSVAAAYGCTKGMVQHYFADKEDLLFGALQHVNQQYDQRAENATRGLAGLDRVEARLVAILPLSTPLREEWVVRLAFYARAALVPQMQSYLTGHVQSALRVATGELRDARRAGEVRQGIDLTRAYRGVIAMVAGIAVSEVVSPHKIPPVMQKRMLRDGIDLLRAG